MWRRFAAAWMHSCQMVEIVQGLYNPATEIVAHVLCRSTCPKVLNAAGKPECATAFGLSCWIIVFAAIQFFLIQVWGYNNPLRIERHRMLICLLLATLYWSWFKSMTIASKASLSVQKIRGQTVHAAFNLQQKWQWQWHLFWYSSHWILRPRVFWDESRKAAGSTSLCALWASISDWWMNCLALAKGKLQTFEPSCLCSFQTSIPSVPLVLLRQLCLWPILQLGLEALLRLADSQMQSIPWMVTAQQLASCKLLTLSELLPLHVSFFGVWHLLSQLYPCADPWAIQASYWLVRQCQACCIGNIFNLTEYIYLRWHS